MYRLIILPVIFSIISCSTAAIKGNTVITGKTKEMLIGYRGETGLKLAIVKASDIDSNSERVSTEIMNTVFQAVFDDGRFVIVERELLKKVLDEIALQQSGLVSGNKINEIGKLSGAQLVLVVRQNSNNSDMRIISVDTGEVRAFISFPQGDSGDSSKAVTNYDKLKAKYLDMDCPDQTRQNKEVIIASFNSYPEDQRELYIMSMIQACKSKTEDVKKSDERKAKAKELNLDKKSVKQLEDMFIKKDSKTYPSKATRKLVVSQYRKAFLIDAVKQNPSMKQYYKDLYNEELVKLILSE